MFYYLYEIRNNLNGKIYVGVHKTTDMNDGYMGSGKVIRSAIKKYGVENFTKTVLETFQSAEEMYAREKDIVTDEFLLREDIYNLRRGGFGGFDHINKEGKNVDIMEQRRRDPSLIQKAAFLGNKTKRYKASIDPVYAARLREISRAGGKASYEKHGSYFSILNKSAEFRRRVDARFRDICHQQGEKNSQHGTMWITNEQESKKIKKTDPIPEGWRKGRKIK